MAQIKNPKGPTYERKGLMLLGMVAGVLGSRALMAAVPNKTGLTADQQKKQDMIKMGTRIAIAGGGFAGSAFADENKANPLVEGMALGAGVIQVIDLITDVAGNSVKIQSTVNNGTKTGRILGRSLGLNCPCDNVTILPSLARPRRKTARLRGEATQYVLNAMNAMATAEGAAFAF